MSAGGTSSGSSGRTNVKTIGVFPIELVGGCWVAPEFSEIGGKLVCTYQDLFSWESKHCLAASRADRPVFGEIGSVLPNTFGPSGLITRVAKQTAFRPSDHEWFTTPTKPGPSCER